MSTLNTQILVSKTTSTDTNQDSVPMCGTSIGTGQGEPDKQLVSPESKVSSNTQGHVQEDRSQLEGAPNDHLRDDMITKVIKYSH